MIDTLSDLRRQAQTGLCSTIVQAFIEQQQAQGYANKSMKLSSRLVNDYVLWLDQRGIDGDSLTEAHATDYLSERWLHRRRRRGDVFTLHAFDRLVARAG